MYEGVHILFTVGNIDKKRNIYIQIIHFAAIFQNKWKKYYYKEVDMLKTPEERIKLLKAGISGKDIEKIYIIYNNIKVIRHPILFEKIR